MTGPVNSTYDSVFEAVRAWKNVEVRESILGYLRQANSDYIVKTLNDLIRGKDDEVRGPALHILTRLNPQQSLQALLALLQDQEPGWRWLACDYLTSIGNAQAVAPLSRVLLEDSDSDVRLMAVTALKHIGDARALPALRHAAESDKGIDQEGRRIDQWADEAVREISTRSSRSNAESGC